MKPTIIIIGAGLSGLLSAYRLKKKGYQVKVVEARNRMGGRIHTVQSAAKTPIEMGATWFGPQHRHLIQLLDELSLNSFKQYMQGSIIYEADSSNPPQLMNIPDSEPSFRIAGGTIALVEALAIVLSEEILLDTPVRSIDFNGSSVAVKTDQQIIQADKVVSTIPPALLISSVGFTPALPEPLIDVASQTHTWMQDSIKVGLAFNAAFWRGEQWSGTLFSNVGPLNELYDHSDFTNSKFALCGFVNEAFSKLKVDERVNLVNRQLKIAFGEQAADYLQYEEVVWSKQQYTWDVGSRGILPHQNNGHEVYQSSFFDKRLYISGTETSNQYGGYMDGAVHASNRTVDQLVGDTIARPISLI